MAKRTPAEVYRALIGAGWPPQAAITMTAIAGGESGWRDDALGDIRLQDSTWGPSYGLFQIRTLKKETGSGGWRDLNALTGDVGFQAKAAWSISKHGTDFSPWTIYNTGRYKDFLGQARAAAGGGATTGSAGDGPLPTFGPDWLPWNKAASAGNDAIGQAVGGARTIALEAAAVVLGLALVGVGLATWLRPQLRKAVGV